MFRPFLLITAACMTPPTALSETEPTEISTGALYACAEIEDGTERLACYDEKVGRLQAAEAAGEVTTVTRSEIDAIERDTFGLSLSALPSVVLPKFGGSDEELQKVEVAIRKIEFDPRDKLRVTLDNDQVWYQTDSRTIRVSKKKPPEMAEIKRAALGSFKMKLDGGIAFRVERIK